MILIKLSHYGLDEQFLTLLNEYFKHRVQRVCYNGTYSSYCDTTSGVIQGSIIGPTLFSVFINDLLASIRHCSCLLYVDDIKVFKCITKERYIDDMMELQSDINQIVTWSKLWQLPIKIEKCHCMVFHNNSNSMTDYSVSYSINGQIIDNCCSIKDLGVTFDCTMSFNNHIQMVATKAAKSCYLISKCFRFSSIKVHIKLYKTFILPIIEYASSVWSPNSQKLIDVIEHVQRRYTHLVFKGQHGGYFNHLKICGLSSLTLHRVYLDCCLLYKMIKTPYSNLNLDGYDLRLSRHPSRPNDILQKLVSSKWSSKKFSRCVAVNWNVLPTCIKEAKNIGAFKKLYHNSMLHQ